MDTILQNSLSKYYDELGELDMFLSKMLKQVNEDQKNLSSQFPALCEPMIDSLVENKKRLEKLKTRISQINLKTEQLKQRTKSISNSTLSTRKSNLEDKGDNTDFSAINPKPTSPVSRT
ncbi:hypothetical protein BB560_004836, partial [Smittium megazygosporum]